MRIGLLTQWYDPETGGPQLPGVLARELVARGHEVQVVTGFPNYPQGRIYPGYRIERRLDESRDGVAVRRVALYPSHDQSSLQRALNYSSFAGSAVVSGLGALRDVDVIWVYNSPATISFPAGLAKLLLRRPHVLQIMDLWPDSIFASGFARSGFRFDVARFVLDTWCKAGYRWADEVVYVTPGVGELLYERGVPRDKLHYVPVWTDESVFRPSPSGSARSDLGINDELVLLYAGALGVTQGLDSLIEACALVSDLDEFKCIIAGSGVAEASLRARANELRLQNVTFLGHVPKEEMTPLMAAGDVHLVSLRADKLSAVTHPSKIQATMASGRPIICAVAGDASAVIQESGAGLVVPPGDSHALANAIRECVRLGRTELNHMGETGRRYYEENFSVRIGVDRIERLLEQAARRR